MIECFQNLFVLDTFPFWCSVDFPNSNVGEVIYIEGTNNTTSSIGGTSDNVSCSC